LELIAFERRITRLGLKAAGISAFLPWRKSPSGPFGVSFTATEDEACQSGVIYMACGDDGYVGAVKLADGRLDVAAALRSGAQASRSHSPRERVFQLLAGSKFSHWSLRETSPLMTTPPLRRRRLAGRQRILAIGDAAGYVEPFTGEGMTWAMHSGLAAAEHIQQWGDNLAGVGDTWTHSYHSLLRHRKLICQAVTGALRWPLVRRAAGRLLSHWPGVARPLVKSLQVPPTSLSSQTLVSGRGRSREVVS
ncbi:MAG: hypothetical protein MI861_10915, partial [Pirellulales bacterium]|nr:hypothetical protein [Pirellulales bacterium]